MHLSKPDIFQVVIVGLILGASALAVPVIATGPHPQTSDRTTAHPAQQAAQL
jgi:hypothetical protein